MIEQKEYICICGKTFTNPHSLGGHKSHCKEWQIYKYGSLENYNTRMDRCIKARQHGYNLYAENLKTERFANLEQWLSEKHKCENCGKVMTEYYGSGRFCSKECASSRVQTEEQNSKRRAKLSKASYYTDGEIDILVKKGEKVPKNFYKGKHQSYKNEKQYILNPNKCLVCGTILPYSYKRKTCSTECLRIALSNHGKLAAQSVEKRSKNEIYFCELCEKYFGKDNVLHNEPLFNGWDADVIIPTLRIAVLWNGPWHYTKITKSHNLKQVQNRDKIKIKEIKKFGYLPYVIKDMGKYDTKKVEEEFSRFLSFIEQSR